MYIYKTAKFVTLYDSFENKINKLIFKLSDIVVTLIEDCDKMYIHISSETFSVLIWL